MGAAVTGAAATGWSPVGSSIQRATWVDAVRSEWTKIRTVRSTFWAYLIAAVLGIGLAALVSAVAASHYATDPSIHFGWNPTDHSLRPLEIAQLAFLVLGVMVVTGEYSTGMIRPSLTAVPRRFRMMSAKLTVFTALSLVIGEIIAFVAFLLGQALISGQAPSASLGQHDVLRAVIGAGLYLTLLGLMSAGVAVLLRQAAAGIGVMVAILLVLPLIAFALPQSWSRPIEEYWPTQAGQQVFLISRDSHTLGAWAGFGVMAAFTAVVLVVAFTSLQRRDA